jgi:hypothetical protein
MNNFRSTVVALALSVAASSVSIAQTASTGGSTSGTSSTSGAANECSYNQQLAKHESGGSGGYQAVTGSYAGKYQMGTSALIDTGYKNKSGGWTGKNGINSQADWLANGPVQEQAQQQMVALQDKYTKGLQGYIGQPIPGCGKPLTQEGLRAAAHLVGAGGAESFLKSGGQCGKAGNGLQYNTTDGNNTCAGTYMCNMSGCTPVQKDMSKKTCDVTMPMIEAISCSNFPAEMQSFCQQALPALMTRGECTSAESWAEKAPKGPNKEACENMSFSRGTGSWSFVLACSWAQEAPADGDGRGGSSGSGQNAGGTGPVSDPACMQKLKGMGVQFDQIGQYTNGSYNGKTCVIQNAVAYRGSAIPFGAKLTMTCDMAIAMEKWGQQMQGIGATSYYGIGSTRPCGPMRDNTGNIPGTITEHALGQAVDVSGFVMGGRKVSMGALLQPGTADGALAAAAKAAACSTFRRVLSPTYAKYLGSYVHFHVEWASQGKCR